MCSFIVYTYVSRAHADKNGAQRRRDDGNGTDYAAKAKKWSTAMCLCVYHSWWCTARREWEIEIVSIIEFISVWRAFLCCRLLPCIMHDAEPTMYVCVSLHDERNENERANKQMKNKNEKLKRVQCYMYGSCWLGRSVDRKSRYGILRICARSSCRNVQCIYSTGNNDGVWHKWH